MPITFCEICGGGEPQYGRAAHEGATLYELSALHVFPRKEGVTRDRRNESNQYKSSGLQMSSSVILWLIVVVMVGVAIVDDILLRRTLGPGSRRGAAHTPPIDRRRYVSGNGPDRARFFGSDGNNERILGMLQSLYRIN